MLRQQLCEAAEKGKAQAAHDYERSSQIVKAENLISEIEFRCGSPQRKYEQKFEDLTDYQILDISQNKNLDLEFNEVLERITSLAVYVTVGRGDSQKLFDSAVGKRDILAEKRMAFQESLQNTITERDITPEKMKSASSLRIELDKFYGYEGKIDSISLIT